MALDVITKSMRVVREMGPIAGPVLLIISYIVYYYLDMKKKSKDEEKEMLKMLEKQSNSIQELTNAIGDIANLTNLLVNANFNYKLGNDETGDEITERVISLTEQINEKYGGDSC